MVGNCRSFLLLVTLGIALCGCQGRAFNPAASMRVEVEVYKGPLSKEIDTQWGELLGLIDEAKITFGHSRKFLRYIEENFELYTFSPSSSCDIGDSVESRGTVDIDDLDCVQLVGVKNDIEWTNKLIDQLINEIGITKEDNTNDDRKDVSDRFHKCQIASMTTHTNSVLGEIAACKEIVYILTQIAQVSVRLKAKSFFWVNMMSTSSPGRAMRGTMVGFANAAAQYSNQLSARAEALLKQISGNSRKQLPLSVYLRDTTPTDFPNLAVWNRAVAPAIWEEVLLQPIASHAAEEVTDRIRVAERLFADEHWTKINTVYASGTGDTGMALIKDDIGNWNLKSFDNDPTKLLKAYTEITLETAERVAELAAEIGTTAATGGASTGLDKATGLLSQLVQGRTSPGTDPFAGLDLTKVKARADQELVALQADFAKKPDTPSNREEALNKAREIVQRYAAVIDALQSAVVDSTRDTATPTSK